MANLYPSSNADDDDEQSLSPDRNTIEGDLEQPDGYCIWFNSLPVSQRANNTCQFLHPGLYSQGHVYGPLADSFVNVWVEIWCLSIQESVNSRNPSFAEKFNVNNLPSSSPFQVHRLEVLIKTSLVASPDAFFESANLG